MLQDFCITHTIPDFNRHKNDVLQKIASLGIHSSICDDQKISNTDWYLQEKVDRSYIQPLLNEIQEALKTLHTKVYALLPDSSVNFKFNQYWFQQYESGDFHSWHAHDVSYAGVIFIELHEGAETRFLVNGETKTIPVSEGQIILFPAMIPHCSPPNMSGHRKTSIAFNVSIT